MPTIYKGDKHLMFALQFTGPTFSPLVECELLIYSSNSFYFRTKRQVRRDQLVDFFKIF